MNENERQYLRGPEFFAWLAKERPSVLNADGTTRAKQFQDRAKRALYRWRDGGQVDMNGRGFEDVLDVLDIGEWEIPAELYMDRIRRGGPRVSKEKHAKIISLYANGATPTQIARALRIAKPTVYRHLRK